MSATYSSNDSRQRAVERLCWQGGMLRTKGVLAAGVHPRTLYALRDEGIIECLSRGLYRLTDAPVLANPDLVVAAKRVPEGAACLLSALPFHQITTQISREIHLAIDGTPRLRASFILLCESSGLLEKHLPGV